jgi:uncharacterized Rmd1/YagE family protein
MNNEINNLRSLPRNTTKSATTFNTDCRYYYLILNPVTMDLRRSVNQRNAKLFKKLQNNQDEVKSARITSLYVALSFHCDSCLLVLKNCHGTCTSIRRADPRDYRTMLTTSIIVGTMNCTFCVQLSYFV